MSFDCRQEMLRRNRSDLRRAFWFAVAGMVCSFTAITLTIYAAGGWR